MSDAYLTGSIPASIPRDPAVFYQGSGPYVMLTDKNGGSVRIQVNRNGDDWTPANTTFAPGSYSLEYCLGVNIPAFDVTINAGANDVNNITPVMFYPVPVIRGPKGDKGDKGDIGPRGYHGDPGDKGDKGDKGDTGSFVQTVFRALKRTLSATDRSCAIQVIGDSTGNDPTDWPYRLAQSLATRYPAWTVHHRLWNDATQRYDAPTVIQTGAAGVRYLDGANGGSTRRLDNNPAYPHLSGVIDARVRIRMPDWTPAANANIFGRSLGSPGRSWYVGINTIGVPYFAYSTDGAAVATMAATAPTGIVDGTDSWLRVVFTPNDGAGNKTCAFYTSNDGQVWTQVGATVTQAGAVALFDPTNSGATFGYEIGGLQGAAVAGMRTYEVQIRNGIDGPNIVPTLPDLWPPYSATAVRVVGAPILTFVNGSKPGANIAYLGDAVRLPKLTPDYGQVVTFLSDSHNEGLTIGAPWVSLFNTWLTNVEARFPSAPTVILTQNPETDQTTWYREHAKRRLDLLGYALQKPRGVVDTYQTFIDNNWPGDLMADAVHPNTIGSDLWANTILSLIEGA